MTRTQLLTVSLVLPFMAVSGVVHANPTTARNRPVTSLSFSSHAEMRSETSECIRPDHGIPWVSISGRAEVRLIGISG
jgi:hypothetical protein